MFKPKNTALVRFSFPIAGEEFERASLKLKHIHSVNLSLDFCDIPYLAVKPCFIPQYRTFNVQRILDCVSETPETRK